MQNSIASWLFAYNANLTYFIRNGNVITHFMVKRDLFVAQNQNQIVVVLKKLVF